MPVEKRITCIVLLVACGVAAGCESATDDDVADDDTVYLYDPSDSNADWDEDGYTTTDDCNDLDPDVHPDQAEVCGNGLDDDCNSAVDCDDSACAGEPDCEQEEETGEICSDGIDNDEDMATDCDDPDCEYSVYCSPCSIQVSGTCDTSWHVFSVYPLQDLGSYGCDGASEPGSEIIYEFAAYYDGVVEFEVDPEDPFLGIGGADVNIYLMEGSCHPDLCTDSSSSGAIGDPESITVEVTAGSYYYVAVEIVGGTSNEFSFSSFCF